MPFDFRKGDSTMIRRFLPAALAAILLTACGGSKTLVRPMMDEFSGYERDIQSLKPLPPAADVLSLAQGKRDQARPLVDKGNDKEAAPIMDEALADVRLALALARADAAQNRADQCLQKVDRAREDWNEVILMLEQTERVAARTISEVSREEPDLPVGSPLPATLIDGAKLPVMTSAELRAAFDGWLSAARARNVSTADLESRFNGRLRIVEDPKTKDEERPRHQYAAGRTVQELEGRVREQKALDLCAQSTELAAQFGDAREQALRATLELERSLKDDLRSQLEEARAEAQARQADLYESLRKLEGRFLSLKKTARGTIVSLADILFDFGKATLKRDVEFNLVKIATILEQFPEMQIEVEGHTDNVGSEEYNLDLSRRRAQAVADFMASQGLPMERMTVAGYGFSRPVEENTTEAGRQKNRRVDLVINE
jgi:outer membrane protein OmpA-like peptidoglycan-associated protein